MQLFRVAIAACALGYGCAEEPLPRPTRPAAPTPVDDRFRFTADELGYAFGPNVQPLHFPEAVVYLRGQISASSNGMVPSPSSGAFSGNGHIGLQGQGPVIHYAEGLEAHDGSGNQTLQISAATVVLRKHPRPELLSALPSAFTKRVVTRCDGAPCEVTMMTATLARLIGLGELVDTIEKHHLDPQAVCREIHDREVPDISHVPEEIISRIVAGLADGAYLSFSATNAATHTIERFARASCRCPAPGDGIETHSLDAGTALLDTFGIKTR